MRKDGGFCLCIVELPGWVLLHHHSSLPVSLSVGRTRILGKLAPKLYGIEAL